MKTGMPLLNLVLIIAGTLRNLQFFYHEKETSNFALVSAALVAYLHFEKPEQTMA